MAELDGLVRRDRRGRYKLTRKGGYLRPSAPGSLDPWVRYVVLWPDAGTVCDVAGLVEGTQA